MCVYIYICVCVYLYIWFDSLSHDRMEQTWRRRRRSWLKRCFRALRLTPILLAAVLSIIDTIVIITHHHRATAATTTIPARLFLPLHVV